MKEQSALNQADENKRLPEAGGRLASPVLTSLGLIRILFWKAAGLLWILSVNSLH